MEDWPVHYIVWTSSQLVNLLNSAAPIITSAIGISAISAKSIGIGYRQYYKMYMGNKNFTFYGQIGHKIVKLCTER